MLERHPVACDGVTFTRQGCRRRAALGAAGVSPLPPVAAGTVRRAETDGEVPPEALSHAIREVVHRV